MQKVEGSNPFSRFATKPLQTGASSFLGEIGTTPTFALHLGNEFPKWPRYAAIGGDSRRFRLAFAGQQSYVRADNEISAPAAVERPGAGTEACTSMHERRYSPCP
jgi:hypothetical protein